MVLHLYQPLYKGAFSVGSIFGIGTAPVKPTNYRVVSNILLSWLLTLPVAAACAGIVDWFMMTFTAY